MSDGAMGIVQLLMILVGGAFGLALLIMVLLVVFKLTWRVTGNIFRFIGETASDTLRLIGAILAAVIFSPMVLLSIVIGRWSASKHYAGAFRDECKAGGRCVYRLFVGNPARLFGVSRALEGVEHRIPDAMAAAPGKDKPPRRVGKFDGYTIIGSLKGGGSGGKLYIAEPDEIKMAVFEKRNLENVDQVVIKSFSLQDGSSLPQIVRESRALDAARSLGLVIEHEMTPERFYYVMRYVPGESLAAVTKNFHALSDGDGLDTRHLHSALGYTRDLLVALNAYHGAGLWHKDVKPDNIIVDGRDGSAQAHLVDFGLVTPLRSAMTLTTHGTEYFRDPELVRQALRGVKVHQIDGSKFDVYGAGAVLFSMVENSFPAHGGLSQITKNCPDALRWIVRRSMAEYDRRYPSAAAMLADVQVVLNAEDPYAVKPADLPSVSAGDIAAAAKQPVIEEMPAYAFGADSSAPKAGYAPQRAASPVPPRGKPVGSRVGRPNAQVHGWWSGKYHVVDGGKQRRGANPDQLEAPLYASRVQMLRAVDDRKPAKQQVKAARKRAHQMQSRAQTRMKSHGGRRGRSYSNSPGASGVFAALLAIAVAFAFVVVVFALVVPVLTGGGNRSTVEIYSSAPVSPVPPMSPLPQMAKMDQMGQHDHDDGPVPMPLLSQQVEASLLVVSDLHWPLPAEDSVGLQAGFADLRASGVQLAGDLIDADDEGMVDTLAGLRHDVGALPLDSPELAKNLRGWIGENPYDGVLWLAYNPDNPDDYIAVMVTDRVYWRQSPIDHETSVRIVKVLAANDYVSENDQHDHDD